ncbi:enterobactin synthase subunit F [Klebsiella pneumoniae]|uniref:Enterobactin synthase subunit F n=1 Tax=Klebsiella pneumoniae TaxID=573 RepID=A0A378CD00_KLEPN|nr:enterobactin synthase subunit F [Klebsiella pneumoniae]
MASAASLDEVCEHHLRTLLAQQPHGPYYLFGYSLGGTLAQGGLPPACASAAKRWPSSACWIPGRRRRKTGQEKEANGLDPEVLAEIDREREAFLATQQGQASGELFQRHRRQLCRCGAAVTTAHSAKFDGKATLFVAEKTRQEGMDPQVVMGPVGGGTGGVQPELRPRRYHLPAGL